MIRLRDLLKLAPAALMVGLFTGCGEEPSTPKNEGAGTKLEKAADKGMQKLEKAAESAVDKVEKAGDKAAEAVDKAADKAADAVKGATDAAVGEPPK